MPAVIEAELPETGVRRRSRSPMRKRITFAESLRLNRRRDGSGWPRGRCEDGRDRAARAEGRRVIGPTGAVRVMVATKPVDFRKGAEGLAALVREAMAD